MQLWLQLHFGFIILSFQACICTSATLGTCSCEAIADMDKFFFSVT